jgi:hypothetical protein
MAFSQGIDIQEGITAVIFMDPVGWDLSCDDL